MAQGINRVVIVGNLTRDPELRHTQGGYPVCGMRIAVNGREKVGEQWQDRADFFDVRVWGNQGEACANHLSRGAPVGVSGRLRLEEWESKDGGGKKSRVLIVADDVQFLGRRSDGDSERSAAFVPAGGDFEVPQGEFSTGDADFPSAVDDDIPF